MCVCISLFLKLLVLLVKLRAPNQHTHTHIKTKGFFFIAEKNLITTNTFYRLPYSSDGKESACNAGDLGLIPGSGRFPGK